MPKLFAGWVGAMAMIGIVYFGVDQAGMWPEKVSQIIVIDDGDVTPIPFKHRVYIPGVARD